MGWVYRTWNLTDPESSLEGAADGMAQVKMYCKDISCGRCAYAHEDDDMMTLRDLSTFATFWAPFKAFGPIQTNKRDQISQSNSFSVPTERCQILKKSEENVQNITKVVVDKPHKLTSCFNKLPSTASDKTKTCTLQETNISPKNGILKMIFPTSPWWDMLIPWRVHFTTPRFSCPKKHLTSLRRSFFWRFQCNNRCRFFSHGWSSQPRPPKR